MLEFFMTLGIIGFFIFLASMVLAVLKVVIAIVIASWILELIGVKNAKKSKAEK